ncbi:hypothetical protein BDW60DRAFT_29290 [Aspergillus nidulans var. acristatus]
MPIGMAWRSQQRFRLWGVVPELLPIKRAESLTPPPAAHLPSFFSQSAHLLSVFRNATHCDGVRAQQKPLIGALFGNNSGIVSESLRFNAETTSPTRSDPSPEATETRQSSVKRAAPSGPTVTWRLETGDWS